MLFEPAPNFEGLPRDGFDLFRIRDTEQRREAIIETIHPALKALGDDLVERLNPHASVPLHAHLPRLDWPREYQPFCTWLALSRETHGYQAGAQLNVGVHEDQVAIRLGWDVAADAFGRFELLARHGKLGREMVGIAGEKSLRFRVFSAAPWPQGSKQVFESEEDLAGSFDEVARRGVWWELGRRYAIPQDIELVCSEGFGAEAARVFDVLLPSYDRIAGTPDS